MIQADNAGRIQEHPAYSGLGHQVLVVRERDVDAARIILAMPPKNVLIHKATSEKKLHSQFCALLSAGISPTLVYDGTYCRLFVSEEDAAAARKVLECALLTLPVGSLEMN
jgi:hypothetical protein